MNYINGAGASSDFSIHAQYDRKEYYTPLDEVEYVYKMSNIQSRKNYIEASTVIDYIGKT